MISPAFSTRRASNSYSFRVRTRRCASRTADLRMKSTSRDRKSTRLNSSHSQISYAVFCLKKKNTAYSSRHPVNDFNDGSYILLTKHKLKKTSASWFSQADALYTSLHSRNPHPTCTPPPST